MRQVMRRHVRSDRYSGLSILLHWSMLILLIAVYAAIELRELFPKGSDPRQALKMWHFMLGLSVLALVSIRIAARLVTPAPAEDGGPPWQRLAAAAVRLGLYGLMVAMPLAGWLILSAEGKPIPFFGLELPPLVAPDAQIAEQIEEWHELGGTIGYVLVGLHAAAALFHHYVLRDGALRRMLPARA